MNIWIFLLIIILALTGLVWIGMKVKPAPFAAFPGQGAITETIPLPANLPEPVDRFYRKLFGDRIPVISSAVMSGRAVMRPFAGIPFQARFRFTHEAGKNYRHYIELTFFGLPIIRVNERYLDGRSLLELPFGVTDQGPKIDQAANLGLWAESISLPSIYLTDLRVRWESVDSETVWLIVPFEDPDQPGAHREDRFLVRFDPQTGVPHFMEAMRYRASGSPSKSLWITETVNRSRLENYPVNAVGAATWFEEGRPWAVFTTEEVVFNADVSAYLRRKGI